MSPRTLTDDLLREAPLVDADASVAEAIEVLLECGLPAVPVVEGEKLVGIFGEREFITALFPAYLGELKYAGFVPHGLDEALQKRGGCTGDPVGRHMNTEHIEVDADYSDAQVAETFLHHRVLIIPVTQDGRVIGVITRNDFFRALAERVRSG